MRHLLGASLSSVTETGTRVSSRLQSHPIYAGKESQVNLIRRLTLVGAVLGLLLASMGSAPRVNAAPTAREHRGRAAWHMTQGRQHRLMQLHHLRRARY